MATKVLITGGAGFVGSHLADELLDRGYTLRVLDNLAPQVHGTRARRPAVVGVGQSMYQIANYTENNSQGTAVLLESLTGISIWVCCGRRVRRNWRCNCLHVTGRTLASVNGSISKIIVSTTVYDGCVRLGVKHLRTGISWADSFRPNAEQWFDRQMNALEEFEVTLTFCFTPEHRGIAPHYTSPPLVPGEFAEFCAGMTRCYAPQLSAMETVSS